MRFQRLGLWLSLAGFLLIFPGCIGATAQLLYVLKGDPLTPAAFEGLKGKRVAVVCVAGTSNYDPSSASTQLAHAVGSILSREIKKIDVVRPDQINDWVDNTNWNQADFRAVGKGVKADFVVGIDLEGLRLREGPTLYKGHASATVRVFDMASGKQVDLFSVPDFTYPVNSGKPVTEINERQFETQFVVHLATHIAKHFYAYPIKDGFAPDRID